MSAILAIDQGTTSSRAIVFGSDLAVAGIGQLEFAQHYPQPGWVEHDPEEIWQTTLSAVRQALAAARLEAKQIAALGITNQRETTIVWERSSGRPIHRAIVWQDRRTADACGRLKAQGAEPLVAARTGLLLDPYFSGTKIAWILDHVQGARARAERGELAFGTVDSWLLWRLTGGRLHATDATNASRTALLDIHSGTWSDELLELFRVPRGILPEVKDCAADYGVTDPALLGAAIPVRGIVGDQQAATIGQACFEPGMMKSTYGTGCFALLNTGTKALASRSRLLTTIAYQLAGKRTYALEGSIFIAGAGVQWLRDQLAFFPAASDVGALAEKADANSGVYVVPAFVGLGAPHWDAEARGAIFGLTRGAGRAEIARATLESVCFQTRDLIEAMRADGAVAGSTVLRVDGGMVASDWTMQCLADILAAPVDRPTVLETTALGAAWLAGHAAGVLPDAAGFARQWRLERRFLPGLDEPARTRRYEGWRRAVAATRSFSLPSRSSS